MGNRPVLVRNLAQKEGCAHRRILLAHSVLTYSGMTGCHMTKFISLPIAINEITSFVQLSYHVLVFHDSFHL